MNSLDLSPTKTLYDFSGGESSHKTVHGEKSNSVLQILYPLGSLSPRNFDLNVYTVYIAQHYCRYLTELRG